MYVISHVDDFLPVFNDKDPKSAAVFSKFKDAFAARFDYEDNGPVHHYLGMEVIYDREAGTMSLVQTAYLQRVLNRFGFSEKSVTRNTPCDQGVDLAPHPDDTFYDRKNLPLNGNLREVVGCLIYAMMNTRPDISYAVSVLASHVANPAMKHFTAATRILRYIAGTLDQGITYTRSDSVEDPWRLSAWTDADYAQDSLTRRSRSGNLIMFCGGPIMWSSSMQKTIALSTTESEYTAAVNLGQDIGYVHQILDAFKEIVRVLPTKMFCDNESTIKVVGDHHRMRRTRHIQVKCLKLQEWIGNGTLQLLKVPSADNLADWFTKAKILTVNFMAIRDVVMSKIKSSAFLI